jgi:hypothetical protein
MEDSATAEAVRTGLAPREVVAIGIGSGLLGAIALAVPIVLWDWARDGHRAFEYPMAATAWLFGLQHFSNTDYHGWSLILGILLLAAYGALSGVVFTALADRVVGVVRPLSSAAAGLVWSFVSFIFFWDMLLPIARNGSPFRVVPNMTAFVAPNWVWILGFTLLGLATGASYAMLRSSPARVEAQDGRRTTRSLIERAA